MSRPTQPGGSAGATAVGRPRAAGTSVRQSNGETVLLVEHDAAIRELAATTLRRFGYLVVEASDANDAIEWSASSGIRPQLLVIAIGLPGLSGPNLAARLLQQHPHLRLLFLSDRPEDATSVDGSSWAIPTLTKPFTPDQLALYARFALDATVGYA
jgi:DNA-binding response OmpR family regulator